MSSGAAAPEVDQSSSFSWLVLPFAGFLVGQGTAIEPLTGQPWNVLLVTLFGTLGATLGALIAYAIGWYGGRPVIERWGRYLGVTPDDLDRADDFFARHGDAAAFFGRMVPIIRSLVSFAAGIAHMRLGRFVVFTFLGSLPWTLLLVVAMYGRVKRFSKAIEQAIGRSWAVVILYHLYAGVAGLAQFTSVGDRMAKLAASICTAKTFPVATAAANGAP